MCQNEKLKMILGELQSISTRSIAQRVLQDYRRSVQEVRRSVGWEIAATATWIFIVQRDVEMPCPCGVELHDRSYKRSRIARMRCHALASWSFTIAATRTQGYSTGADGARRRY